MSDRCTGHCCRTFTLPYGPEDLRRRVEADEVADGPFILDMVRYLGLAEWFPGAAHSLEAAHALGQSFHHYTCRHLDAESGDCTRYEERPGMCRDYPYGNPCLYEACTAPEVLIPAEKLLRSSAPDSYENEDSGVFPR